MMPVKPLIVSKGYKAKRNCSILIASIFAICLILRISFYIRFIKSSQMAQPLSQETQSAQKKLQRIEPAKSVNIVSEPVKSSAKIQPKEKETAPESKMNAIAYLKQGETYLRKDRYDNAIDAFTKAIEIDSKFARAYYNRGIAYSLKKTYGTAIFDFTKAIELEPTLGLSYFNRGRCYLMIDIYDAAIFDFTKAIELDPKRAKDYYLYRGIVYSSRGDYHSAISEYTKAIELDSKFVNAYRRCGEAYEKLNRNAEAESDFRRAKWLEAKNK